ncbi:MAG: SDR family oxidoreductase [Fretibacterium sp.]|nr:SDR family oxidoreductase [Fretibacterium sp.]
MTNATQNPYVELFRRDETDKILEALGQRRWLVTGAAGFIGSHLVEALLSAGQSVVGLDDFSTGRRQNLDRALALAGPGAAERFVFLEGSILSKDTCLEACRNVDFILHHAALASVPLSLEHPLDFNAVNVDGFLILLEAARSCRVRRVVYATSSAVYGDDPALPKSEEMRGEPLSPYALSKAVNEQYASLWTRAYGLECTGLRYFNVFGPRQDPDGAYAAVIPRWIEALRQGASPVIFGDGETSRDFCSVRNTVLANIRAVAVPEAAGRVFNIACGLKTTLNELFEKICAIFAPGQKLSPVYEPFRPGDIVHSLASIQKAQKLLGYRAHISLEEGLREMRDEE